MLFISMEIIGLLLKTIAYVHVLFICEKMPFYAVVFGIFLEHFYGFLCHWQQLCEHLKLSSCSSTATPAITTVLRVSCYRLSAFKNTAALTI